MLPEPLPAVQVSADPQDDFLLAIAEAGRADYLASGDKRGLLALGHWKGTHIVTAHALARGSWGFAFGAAIGAPVPVTE